MKKITCYIDFISPYAYLAFHAAPQVLQGISHVMEYKPVLFAAMLKHNGQLGPAEIAGKREWTYRQVLWHAHALGLPMQMPAKHPFNPLALLRLALACSCSGVVNRYVCETIFEHVWNSGLDAQDEQRLAQLAQSLNPAQALDAEVVKAQLKANTEDALSQGVFGVPTFVVQGQQFWGYDALPMLKAYLSGDAWFDAQWERAGQLPQGVTRKAAG
jgi:2-hydroxychromene-2-carboxylate isomerase